MGPEKSTDSSDKLNTLYEIAFAANAARTADGPMRLALERLCVLYSFPLGHVFGPAGGGHGGVVPTAIWYLSDPEAFPKFRSETASLVAPSSALGLDEALATGSPQWITRIDREQSFVRRATAIREGIVTGVFVPVLVEDDVGAILEMFSTAETRALSGDMEFLANVGAILGRTLERQRSQAAEAERDQFFALSSDLVAVTDIAGVFLQTNAAWTRLLGWKREDLVGRRSIDFVHPDDRDAALRKQADVFDGGTRSGLEMRFRAADGIYHWLSWSLSPHLRESNVFLVARDVTEARQERAALEESEYRFRSTFEQAEVGFAHVSLDGRFLRVNRRFCQMAGYGVDEIYECPADRVAVPDAELDEISLDRELLLGTRSHYSSQRTYRRRDGTGLWVNETVSLARNSDGSPAYYIVVIVDISRTKSLEAELTAANQLLERRVADRTAHLETLNRELEAFSYSVSHDLRAPLRSIDGFSQAIHEDYFDLLDDEGRDFLTRIRSETKRMGALIDDLLRLARISRAELHRRDVDVSVAARAVFDTLRQAEPERAVAANVEEGIVVSADPRLLEIVLQNVLSNAWKYTRRCEHAVIDVGRVAGSNEVFVRDNGSGFEPRYADRLFVPFQRLHSDAEFEGTGVGLATVQRIVHRHGGAIRAESEPGRGATFYFQFGEGRDE